MRRETLHGCHVFQVSVPDGCICFLCRERITNGTLGVRAGIKYGGYTAHRLMHRACFETDQGKHAQALLWLGERVKR